jgi:hypothetical protein
MEVYSFGVIGVNILFVLCSLADYTEFYLRVISGNNFLSFSCNKYFFPIFMSSGGLLLGSVVKNLVILQNQ